MSFTKKIQFLSAVCYGINLSWTPKPTPPPTICPSVLEVNTSRGVTAHLLGSDLSWALACYCQEETCCAHPHMNSGRISQSIDSQEKGQRNGSLLRLVPTLWKKTEVSGLSGTDTNTGKEKNCKNQEQGGWDVSVGKTTYI